MNTNLSPEKAGSRRASIAPSIQEKNKEIQLEYVVADEESKTAEAADYSGAAKKTDPAEIALVRKLDTWIMPTLWIMVSCLNHLKHVADLFSIG